jgi:hypothetical protein
MLTFNIGATTTCHLVLHGLVMELKKMRFQRNANFDTKKPTHLGLRLLVLCLVKKQDVYKIHKIALSVRIVLPFLLSGTSQSRLRDEII